MLHNLCTDSGPNNGNNGKIPLFRTFSKNMKITELIKFRYFIEKFSCQGIKLGSKS